MALAIVAFPLVRRERRPDPRAVERVRELRRRRAELYDRIKRLDGDPAEEARLKRAAAELIGAEERIRRAARDGVDGFGAD